MQLPLKLATTVSKIKSVPSHTNSIIIDDFYQHVKSNGCSDHHQNNNLKAPIAFAKFLRSNTTFYACSAHTIDLNDYLVPVPGNCNRLLRTN